MAALGVIYGPLTARLGYSEARKSDAERWDREHQADEERQQRRENGRRLQRGEDVAKDILMLVDRAYLLTTDYSAKAGQEAFKSLYHDIRQLAQVLTIDRHAIGFSM